MKLSYLILFFGIPFIIFGMLFVARDTYGIDVPVALLVVLSFFPLGFVLWILARVVIQMIRSSWGMDPGEDPLLFAYTGSRGSAWRVILFLASIVVFVGVMYVLIILLRDVAEVLPILKVFL